MGGLDAPPMSAPRLPRGPGPGRTRPGRLDALDAWLVHEAATLLGRGGLVVDVGFGESSVTVAALAGAVRRIHPGLEVLGLEREPSRVAAAAAAAPGGAGVGAGRVRLMAGGFEVLSALSDVLVVRAMNVLRAYRAEDVPAAHRALGACLGEGGLLLEGSTDTAGHVTASHLFRRRGPVLRWEGLLLLTDFSRGFSPWLFRDWLPRDLRRSVAPGTVVHELLVRWGEAVDAQGPGRDARARFVEAVPHVPGLAASTWELAHGAVRVVAPLGRDVALDR